MPSAILPKHLLAAVNHETRRAEVSPSLAESAAVDVYTRLDTRAEGLTSEEAAARLARHGPNVLAKDQRAGIGKLLWHAVLNPLVVLLALLATVSFATGDLRAGSVMCAMIVLGVSLKLIQEAKADSAAAKLKRMISVTATVIRDGHSRSWFRLEFCAVLIADSLVPSDWSITSPKRSRHLVIEVSSCRLGESRGASAALHSSVLHPGHRSPSRLPP